MTALYTIIDSTSNEASNNNVLFSMCLRHCYLYVYVLIIYEYILRTNNIVINIVKHIYSINCLKIYRDK